MSAARLWWVRHGPTHAKTMVGWTDLPADLSDHAAIGRLSAHLPTGAPVVASDLARARSTADAICGDRQRLADDPALRELHFGAWEDRSFAEVETEEPDRIFAFWDAPGAHAAPGGESWHALSARVSAAADALAARGGDVIVVAHFGAILTQLERALGLPTVEIFAQKIDNLSVTRLDHDGKRWHAHSINQRP